MDASQKNSVSPPIKSTGKPLCFRGFTKENGAAEKTVHHQGFLHFSQILTVKSSVFKADVSQIVSRLAKPTGSGSVSSPQYRP